MSQNKKKDDAKLVEKYLRDFPEADRKYLGRLIRAENAEYQAPSGRRRLDRKLRKIFSKQNTTIHFKRDSNIEIKTKNSRKDIPEFKNYDISYLKEE